MPGLSGVLDSLAYQGNKLLVGRAATNELYICSSNGTYFSPVDLSALSFFDRCLAVAWISRDRFVCAATSGVFVIGLPSGRVLTRIRTEVELSLERSVSVSPNGTIYVSQGRSGIIVSTNLGATWNNIKQLQPSDGWETREVLVMVYNDNEYIWTVETWREQKIRLLVYSSPERSAYLASKREVLAEEFSPQHTCWRLRGSANKVFLIQPQNGIVRVFNATGNEEDHVAGGNFTKQNYYFNWGSAVTNDRMYLAYDHFKIIVLRLTQHIIST